MLDLGPNGHEHGEAWRLLVEARRLLGQYNAEVTTVLALGRAALDHARVNHVLSADPGTDFLSARLHDAVEFGALLDERGSATQASVGTLLLAVEFVLKACYYQATTLDRVSAGIAT